MFISSSSKENFKDNYSPIWFLRFYIKLEFWLKPKIPYSPIVHLYWSFTSSNSYCVSYKEWFRSENVPTERFDISVPIGDVHFDPFGTGNQTIDFHRAGFDTTTGTSSANPRRHPNLVTSFLDASVVYGSDSERAQALRTLDGTGKLKTSSGNLLPFRGFARVFRCMPWS